MAAAKIKVANPVVDLDGDEMTRCVLGGWARWGGGGGSAAAAALGVVGQRAQCTLTQWRSAVRREHLRDGAGGREGGECRWHGGRCRRFSKRRGRALSPQHTSSPPQKTRHSIIWDMIKAKLVSCAAALLLLWCVACARARAPPLPPRRALPLSPSNNTHQKQQTINTKKQTNNQYYI